MFIPEYKLRANITTLNYFPVQVKVPEFMIFDGICQILAVYIGNAEGQSQFFMTCKVGDGVKQFSFFSKSCLQLKPERFISPPYIFLNQVNTHIYTMQVMVPLTPPFVEIPVSQFKYRYRNRVKPF